MVNGDAGGLGAFVAFHFAFCILHSAFCISPSAAQSIPDEFRIKRQAVFEFAEKPTVARDGDSVTVRFAAKGFCDATVAIEDAAGRIVRHLASGVLGPNAPAPFAKGSLRQTLVWDGKDDAGAYVDTEGDVVVRVSLGLKPRFERTLFWHPGKSAGEVLAFAPGTQGVFVFQSGQAVDHLRLFDRDGDYLRTIYPFPSDRLADVKGLIYHRFPDGPVLPIKPNWLQSTLLMSGTSCDRPTWQDGQYQGIQSKGVAGVGGTAGFDLAVAGERIALTGHRFSRLSADGTSGGLNLHGPELSLNSDKPLWRPDSRREEGDLHRIRPRRAALSPDGRWLYVTRYNETFAGSFGIVLWRHLVTRIAFDGMDAPEDFVGSAEEGRGDDRFNMPADVACDAEGRVYVADHLNDRVAVFSPEGRHLKSIPVRRPAQLSIHHGTGELFVFSWALPLPGRTSFRGTDPSLPRGEADGFFRLTRFSALDEARMLASWDLGPATGLTRTRASNVELSAAVDTWSDPPRVWLSAPSPVGSRQPHGLGAVMLVLDGDRWTVQRDLLDEAARAISRPRPAAFNRQRLAVNPADGMLYLVEGDTSHGKAFQRVLRIDPRTGRTREVDLPMSTEDLAFDRHGHAYLRTSEMIVRYRPDTWREIPFDYGEERGKHHYGSGGGERSARIISGAMFPGNRGFHQGGMHISPKGHIVIGSLYSISLDSRRAEGLVHETQTWQPLLYPGRRYDPGGRFGGMFIHILNRHGELLHADAVPGLHALVNGVAIDANDDVYLLNASPRVHEGQRHFNDHAGTLMKFTPGKGRLLAPGGAPVPLTDKPARPPDLHLPTAWVEGAHWMYPGVGWGGQNYTTGCSCPNARFALDYFARSFTPEIDRYNVGVLDSNGNLILRVGQYGNVDDGAPLIAEGGPAKTRAVGGDETSLFFAPYVATHTDRRLFIADPGNARIVSVELDYHATETVSLK